jgi:hypothetical protein
VTLSEASTIKPTKGSIPLNTEVTSYILTGWLLKKRRKKMQGWAKRWFRLDTSGILSYMDSPTATETRGVLYLVPTTIIHHQPKQLGFYIQANDDNNDDWTYYLKALTMEDYTKWTTHLKQLRMNQVNQLETWQLKRQSGHLTSIIKNKARKDVARGLQASQIVKEKLLNLDQWIQEHQIKPSNLLELKIAVKRQEQLWYVIQDTIWQADPFGLNKAFEDISLENENDEAIIVQSNRLSMNSIQSNEDFYDAQDQGNIYFNIIENELYSLHFQDEEEKSCMLDYSIQPNRREQLPSIAVGEASSAISIIRKNVGKDLSTIALPVSMNEPISILQRACEELEYSELLDKASQLDNSMDRLIYVTIFAITSYASSQYRTGRKVSLLIKQNYIFFYLFIII